MKTETAIILVVGAAALLFWAVSSGLIKSVGGPINVGGGVVAPQPSQNYSGYLAASTAPGVSQALNGALSGLSNLFGGWIGSKLGATAPASAPTQGSNVNSPSLSAQPQGPVATSAYDDIFSFVGPQVNPDLAYNATAGSAFDYSGLSAANTFDPEYSLMDPQLV